MSALATAQGADQLGDVGALTDGYTAAFLGAAGVALAGGLLAAVLLRPTRSASSSEAPAERVDPPVAA
jgi:hypothetical protein